MTTPFTDLLNEFRARRSLVPTLRDFSTAQIQAFAHEGIRQVSLDSPRYTSATVTVEAGNRQVLLPDDWLGYRDLADLAAVEPLYDVQPSPSPPLGSPFGYLGWNTAQPRPKAPMIATRSDGRFVWTLRAAEAATRDAAISYLAYHSVRDATDDDEAVNTLDPHTRGRVVKHMLSSACNTAVLQDGGMDAGRRLALGKLAEVFMREARDVRSVTGLSA